MAMALPGMRDFTKATKDATRAGGVFTRGVGSMVGGFKKLTGSADQAKNGLDQGRDAMGHFTSAGAGVGTLPPQVAAVGMAMAAVTIAVLATVMALGSLMALAIEVTQQRSALQATFAALGGGALAGKQVMAMVDSLSSKLPFSTGQIAGWAKSLESAGITGKELERAVEAVAAATAIMGESGGAAAEKMLKTLAEGGAGASKMMENIQKGGAKGNRLLAEMGTSVEDVAKAAGMSVAQFQKAHMSADDMAHAIEKAVATRGAGPLGDMMLTFPVLAMKAKEGFMSLFEGLGPVVKPFMHAVQGLFSQFGRGTPVMKALGAIVTTVFGTLFRWATKAVTAVSAFVKANATGKSIGGVWNTISAAVAKVGAAIARVWKVLKPLFTSPAFLKGIVAVFKMIGMVVGVAVAVWLVMVAVLATVVGVIGNVLGVLSPLVDEIWDFIGGILSGSSAAGQFVQGLIDGILSGTGAFVSAVTSLASQGLAAFKSVLGIHSPSAVMAEMGGHMGGGLEKGLDKSAGGVGDAAAKLGAGAAGAAGAAGGGKGGGKATTVTISPGAVVIHGAGKIDVNEETLALIFERLLMSQGLGAT